MDRQGAVRFKGQPLTLTGSEVKLGKKAPKFSAVGQDMSPVELSQFAGKIVIIMAVPSLDTHTCNIEARRFDDEVRKLDGDVVLLSVSMDLPFAQKRWCDEAGTQKLITASDYRGGQFGKKYGVLIKELGLLARAVFVVDRDGKVKYQQLVEEISQEPDYDQVISVVAAMLARDRQESAQPEPAHT